MSFNPHIQAAMLIVYMLFSSENRGHIQVYSNKGFEQIDSFSKVYSLFNNLSIDAIENEKDFF